MHSPSSHFWFPKSGLRGILYPTRILFPYFPPSANRSCARIAALMRQERIFSWHAPSSVLGAGAPRASHIPLLSGRSPLWNRPSKKSRPPTPNLRAAKHGLDAVTYMDFKTAGTYDTQPTNPRHSMGTFTKNCDLSPGFSIGAPSANTSAGKSKRERG